MSINTTLNYSPNFDKKKRKFKQIKFIIFHYTGMKNEKVAIKRLTNSKSKVSSHYFIKYNGQSNNIGARTYILVGTQEFRLGKITNQLTNTLLV